MNSQTGTTSTPAVAVVIPAHNAGRFLSATLECLARQTFKNFGSVVVNDGSTDNTSQVVGQFSAVKLIEQVNAGVAAARNCGARETKSEWLAFLDADDLWLPEKLELQMLCAHAMEAGAVFCDLKIVDADGIEVAPTSKTDVSLEMEPLLLHSESIPQGTSSTLLVKRSVFETIGGYDESLATMADWDLLIRLRQVTNFAHVPRALTAYRRYAGTMSRSVAMLERESRIVLDKAFSRTDLKPEWRHLETESRAWNDLVLSGSYFEAGNIGRAFRFGAGALWRNPALAGRVLGMPFRRFRRRVGA